MVYNKFYLLWYAIITCVYLKVNSNTYIKIFNVNNYDNNIVPSYTFIIFISKIRKIFCLGIYFH